MVSRLESTRIHSEERRPARSDYRTRAACVVPPLGPNPIRVGRMAEVNGRLRGPVKVEITRRLSDSLWVGPDRTEQRIAEAFDAGVRTTVTICLITCYRNRGCHERRFGQRAIGLERRRC